MMPENSLPDLEKVFNNFEAKGSFEDGKPYGNGHIHDTYKITTRNADYDYILQKLNNDIFNNIPSLQENISRVTKHIRDKLISLGEKDIDRKCLRLIESRDNKSWFTDEHGHFWRMYIYITDHKSYDIVKTAQQAYEGGKAIGRFQALLSDLPGKRLHETIPYFHDIENRLKIFYNTLLNDPVGRASSIAREIEFIRSREEEMKTILRLGRKGKIPLRITHNDTKFNNVLLDENDKALCVIDLDTVMPGYVHYDFGDAIRTAANSAAEDETDLSKVYMNTELFKAWARGYLSEIKEILNSTELEYLAISPSLITYTIGLRFLTDFLDGDRYFKIHKDNHNLIRARTQFRLVESNEEQIQKMKAIIKKL